jgi:hypothetical protein
MVVANYGYLIMKLSLPNDIIKICGDHSASVSALEKLQALAVTHDVTASQGALD